MGSHTVTLTKTWSYAYPFAPHQIDRIINIPKQFLHAGWSVAQSSPGVFCSWRASVQFSSNQLQHTSLEVSSESNYFD